MKRALTILAVAGLLGLFASAAMAATDAEYVTVSVASIDSLSVPDSTSILLNAVDSADNTKYAQGTKTDADGLKYSHNATGTKKITATAVADTGNADVPVGWSYNDITLKVAVEGQTAVTIVNAGADVTRGAVVWTGIAAGGYTKDLVWTADGTLAGTPPDDYGWSVTFTSADS